MAPTLAAGRRASSSGGQTVRKRGQTSGAGDETNTTHRKTVFCVILMDPKGSSGMIANVHTRRECAWWRRRGGGPAGGTRRRGGGGRRAEGAPGPSRLDL